MFIYSTNAFHFHFNLNHFFKIEVFICGWLASVLRMRRPIKENISKKIQSKKEFYSSNSFNDFNELSSKSLLANVLDISDDFGVLKKSKKKPNILNEQINNNYLPYPNGKNI